MSKALEHLNTLEAAILIRHKCKPTHRERVFVREKTIQNETIWCGDVEVFDLEGHNGAKTCYAWRNVDDGGKVKIFVLLANQFVDSPKRAVQAALFMDAQPPHHRFAMDIEALKHQLEECKNILKKIGLQAEDLYATVEGSREARES
jgi:hypothetical protein